MARKRAEAILDPVHGASGHEMSDADVAELAEDTRAAETEEVEPQLEPEEIQEELPEEIPQPEVSEEPEPEEEPEVDRLKRLGLYRPGMIESFDDLGKSYRHLEAAFSNRPKVEVSPPPAPDPQKTMDELAEEYSINPIAATAKIAQAMTYGTQQEIAALRNELFYTTNPGARDHQDGIDAVMKRYPGIGIRDAYNLYRGENFDKLVQAERQSATQLEKRRASEKTMALRESAGGVRTSPVSPEQRLNMAVQGKSGTDATNAMIEVLEKMGLGLKE